MEGQTYLYKCPNHPGNLNEMRLQDHWCDVTIRVNGVEIRAHKVILAANLRYFKTMLLSESFQESKEGVITMESVEETYLEEIICYAYTGKILLTTNNALNLLELANYLGEEGIKKACISFLEEYLKLEDALRAYTFSNAIECLSLNNVAKSKILLSFDVCSQSSDYLDFDYKSLIDLLSDGKRQPIKSQEKFFEGIMRWIMHDTNKRKIRMSNLLNSISLTKLTTEYFMNYLGNEAYCNDKHGVIRDILFCYHSSIIEHKKVLMIVGEADHKFHFQLYNFMKKKWSSLQEIPDTDGGTYSNGAVLNDQLYYISQDSQRYNLQRFNPATKEHVVLNSPNILKWSTLCACSRFVYMCGGVKEDGSRTDQVLRYDAHANTFELLAPMQMKRKFSAAIFYQGSLHVLGGSSDDSIQNTVEKYDTVTKKWMRFPSMRKSRYGFGVAVLDGKLYACGGMDSSTSSVEVYDPEKNSWQLVASMLKPRIHLLTFAHEGKLVAIRGNNDSTAEVYDPSKDQWQIDHQISSGLEITYPRGGLVSASCISRDE